MAKGNKRSKAKKRATTARQPKPRPVAPPPAPPPPVDLPPSEPPPPPQPPGFDKEMFWDNVNLIAELVLSIFSAGVVFGLTVVVSGVLSYLEEKITYFHANRVYVICKEIADIVGIASGTAILVAAAFFFVRKYISKRWGKK